MYLVDANTVDIDKDMECDQDCIDAIIQTVVIEYAWKVEIT